MIPYKYLQLSLEIIMSIFNIIWKISSVIIAAFITFELLVISPILLLLFFVYKTSAYIAPDVFTIEPSCLIKQSRNRKILLCIDPTSAPCVNWTIRDFPIMALDQVLLVHVIEPAESIQIPDDSICFNSSNIDTKDFFIPQYISEIGHWLQKHRITYEGMILKPLPKCTVAETILKIAQKYSADCIVASASEHAGT